MADHFTIAQFPNPPLIAAVAAAVFARRSRGPTADKAALAAYLALLLWAYQEISSGANWFRRLLGVAGIAYSAASLVHSAPRPGGGRSMDGLRRVD